MNKKFNTGVYTIATILGVIAGGLFIKSKLQNKKVEEEEIDELADEIDIFA